MPTATKPRTITVHFPPLRPSQRALFDARKRFNVWVCHRRMGKTTLGLYLLIHAAYLLQRSAPRYAYLAPLYRQAKSVAWDMLRALVTPLPGTTVHETDLRVDLLGGGRIQLFGAENPDTLRGLYFDGCIFDEYAQMRPRLWAEVMRPALADREGWAVFLGTPRGKNHFYDLYQQALTLPDWHAAAYKASETGIVPAPELDSARVAMSADHYAQEFEVSFEAALVGAYYGSYLETAQAEGRLTTVPWLSHLPVDTSWDLGVHDATAIWFFQRDGAFVNAIDYLEATDQGIEWYARALQAKSYVYGRHYFPHDIAARDWSADGRTRLQIAESLGLRNAVVVPQHDVGNGIQAVRTLLGRMRFDAVRCAEGLEALKAYRREWSEERRAWSDRPLHDFASHAADSLRTYAMGWSEPFAPSQPPPVLPQGKYAWMG